MHLYVPYQEYSMDKWSSTYVLWEQFLPNNTSNKSDVYCVLEQPHVGNDFMSKRKWM